MDRWTDEWIDGCIVLPVDSTHIYNYLLNRWRSICPMSRRMMRRCKTSHSCVRHTSSAIYQCVHPTISTRCPSFPPKCIYRSARISRMNWECVRTHLVTRGWCRDVRMWWAHTGGLSSSMSVLRHCPVAVSHIRLFDINEMWKRCVTTAHRSITYALSIAMMMERWWMKHDRLTIDRQSC